MLSGPQPRRVLGYARVSSAEQALGTSLADQQNRIKAHALARGLKIDRIFVEAESAVFEKFERREQIQALMSEARAGDLILVDKVDRWSRDPEFIYRSVRELRETGVRIFFVEEQIDPHTSDGDSMMGMRSLFAREEHKRIRVRMVGTRKAQRDAGLYSEGHAPYGYERRAGKGTRAIDKNALRIVPSQAEVVREVFRAARTVSVKQLVKQLRETHPEKYWDSKGLGQLLKNRVYLGEVRDSRGVWRQGQHEAIVDASTFDAARTAMISRRKGGRTHGESSKTRDWLLRRVARCAACGAGMTSVYGGGTGPGTYARFYYSCRGKCGARLVAVRDADDKIGPLVISRIQAIRDLLDRALVRPKSKREAIDFETRRAKLAGRRERAIETYTEGTITKDEFTRLLAKIDAERTKLDAQEADAKASAPTEDLTVRMQIRKLVDDLQLNWETAFNPKKRRIVEILAKSVRLARAASPVVEWRSPDELAKEVGT